MKKETHYEVFVDSSYGSDVLEFSDLNEAIAEAEKWADEIHHARTVVVLKVERELVHSIEKNYTI